MTLTDIRKMKRFMRHCEQSAMDEAMKSGMGFNAWELLLMTSVAYPVYKLTKETLLTYLKQEKPLDNGQYLVVSGNGLRYGRS